MKKLLLLAFIVSSLFSKDILLDEICYKFDKKNFVSSLDKPYDVIVDISFLKDKNQKDKWLFLSLSTDEKIPYLSDGNGFFCMKEHSFSYYCVADDDGGKIKLDKKGEKIFLNIEHAILSETPDDPVIHEIKSKSSSYSLGERINCIN